MRNMEKTGHLAWCALVALHTAREDGLVLSESQENLFINRWFAQAKKQRRFPRDVATDIDWILDQGRRLGVRAGLRHKLDYLWRSCTGELSEQNDLFRLTYALELAKQYDWVYHVLSDSEWSGRRQIQPSASVNSIFLLKSALEIGFNDDGKQVMPVPARIGGRAGGLNTLLKSCGWEAVSNDTQWILMAIRTG
ncbi:MULTISPECIES: DUF2913 family protein [Enterobacter]|uniref:DUF2913 family protein n=1 Tax=Enterobacter TaxID=547 RepID=UPI000F0B531E|nr:MULTISPECIES: DUF2913 family protein [Enterobacter]AYU97737.1 DUF2913 family protein [Enterobacter cloacae]MCG7803966.1 DUF2913 family protein [Enterobacter asburiae]UAN18746.1 DUF2913 family protein [Enterobacter asburiae]UAN24683.1 DUF2913 family protein [Enterobacter sp. JBIWA003]UAN34215.1 DUF2913 family protein [Enterobacter sp. JBIWA005]